MLNVKLHHTILVFVVKKASAQDLIISWTSLYCTNIALFFCLKHTLFKQQKPIYIIHPPPPQKKKAYHTQHKNVYQIFIFIDTNPFIRVGVGVIVGVGILGILGVGPYTFRLRNPAFY